MSSTQLSVEQQGKGYSKFNKRDEGAKETCFIGGILGAGLRSGCKEGKVADSADKGGRDDAFFSLE